MDYRIWIERERRIRLKILAGSEEIAQTQRYRVCEACDEVLLCHEEQCPNCGERGVVLVRIQDIARETGERIRCIWRFERL